ncbi:MAG: hypothetical protein MUF51_07160, partial [Vicinamibacteria bacterium]|nr:hypothetical protein [Vicinamibacteria bacterium]
MRNRLAFWTLLVLGLVCSACVISEQVGDTGHQLPGYGAGYSEPMNVVFHFSSTFNRTMVGARVLGLLLAAFWLFKALPRPAGAIVGLILIGATLFMLARDVPTLTQYRIEARIKDGLFVRIPPQPERLIPWDRIEHLRIEGYTWQPGQTLGPPGKGGPVFLQLPDWRTMTVVLTGNESVVIDVERLS